MTRFTPVSLGSLQRRIVTNRAMLMPFDLADERRVSMTLNRFLLHVDRSMLALTGGVTVELDWTTGNSGVITGRWPTSISSRRPSQTIAPSVTATFLLSHFHLAQSGYSRFMVQLVDPDTRL